MNIRICRALGRIKHRIDNPHRNIPSQCCAVWVPAARGYLAEVSPTGFRVVEFAELACHWDEDSAARAALTFRERTGLQVTVRPVHLQPARKINAGTVRP